MFLRGRDGLVDCVARTGSLSWRLCWACCRPLGRRSLLKRVAVAAPVKDSAGDVITIADEDLVSIFDGARAPATLADLRRMEQRQKEVAARVIPCTVGIRVGAAQGSGVLINADGYILTAAHVAQVPDQPAQIVLHDGRRVRGVTLGMNRKIDAGLVRIEEDLKAGESWPFVEMGKSENVRPGQWCVATGHPGGYVRGRDPVFRVGRVLARDRTVIVTDCPLIGGDSGGPLFDMDGKVIGINSRIGPPLTANMHVPVSAYSKDWEAMAQGDIFGDVPRGNPYIGVQSEDAADGVREALDREEREARVRIRFA